MTAVKQALRYSCPWMNADAFVTQTRAVQNQLQPYTRGLRGRHRTALSDDLQERGVAELCPHVGAGGAPAGLCAPGANGARVIRL